jgi:hypothetical protein
MRRNTVTPGTIARRCIRSARHALSKTDTLVVDTKTVVNSTDYAALLKDIRTLPRPFAVWVVRTNATEPND